MDESAQEPMAEIPDNARNRTVTTVPFSTEEPCDHPSASTSTTAQGGCTLAISARHQSGTTRDRRFPRI